MICVQGVSCSILMIAGRCTGYDRRVLDIEAAKDDPARAAETDTKSVARIIDCTSRMQEYDSS